MWTVVYMTQSEEKVVKVTGLLKENGIIYKLKPVGNDSHNICFEVLVVETEINEAHKLIIDNNLL